MKNKEIKKPNYTRVYIHIYIYIYMHIYDINIINLTNLLVNKRTQTTVDTTLSFIPFNNFHVYFIQHLDAVTTITDQKYYIYSTIHIVQYIYIYITTRLYGNMNDYTVDTRYVEPPGGRRIWFHLAGVPLIRIWVKNR